MRQEIKFKGLTLNGDEYSAQNGELALCAGVEMHDGALRPSVLSGSTMANGKTLQGDLLYVHTTASYRHFITSVDDEGVLSLLYSKEFNKGWETDTMVTDQDFDLSTIHTVASIGNTVIFLNDTGLHYVIFQNNKYRYIGQKPPFIELQFNVSDLKRCEYGNLIEGSHLQCEEYKMDGDFFDNPDATGNEDLTVKDDKQAEFTDAVWAVINRANNTIAHDGYFYAPFMVRYCYRMYDNTTLIMHSPTVYIPVSHPFQYPVVVYREGDGSITLTYSPNAVALKCAILNSDEYARLKSDWEDIISSIDIFVTPPIVREIPSEKITKTRYGGYFYHYRNSILTPFVHKSWYANAESEWNIINRRIADIELKTDEQYQNLIKSQESFYLIHQFKLGDNISSEWSEIPVEKGIIQNLTLQEKMTDDYKSHNLLLPVSQNSVYGATSKCVSPMYVYNRRLNIFGLQERLFEGFSLNVMFPSIIGDTSSISILTYPLSTFSNIYVEIVTGEGNKIVRKAWNKDFQIGLLTMIGTVFGRGVRYVEGHGHGDVVGNVGVNCYPVCPVFYPDARAKRMVVQTSDNQYYAIDLEPCNLLNGAIAIGEFKLLDEESIPAYAEDSGSDTIPLPNTIYTSEVDNPFYFPAEGRNTVGIGTIIGIAVVTRALSQGQFGQHDLMAFCSDGIWALSVAKNGLYSGAHNISREVCINPDSICQLDQSVLFATSRGLSRIVESDVIPCSEMLDGPFFDIGSLPRLKNYFQEKAANDEMLQLINFKDSPIDFFADGKIIYDFANSRVMVFPSDTTATEKIPIYVFSLRDKTWSTMLIPAIRKSMNSYPYPYLQLNSGTTLCLDKPYDFEDTHYHNGLIITRSLNFSTVVKVIQGFEQLHSCNMAPVLFLYGSNDNRSWNFIGRTARPHASYLPGHAFRFFRIGAYLTMINSDKYTSLILDVIEKYAKL